MPTLRSAPLVGVIAGSSIAALVAIGAPQAHAANGVFVFTGSKGQESIPFPEEDKCYPTPGGTVGMNYSVADAYLYTDTECTIGKDAGNIGPFANRSVPFESVRLRTSGS